jgi:hypothetical protein
MRLGNSTIARPAARSVAKRVADTGWRLAPAPSLDRQWAVGKALIAAGTAGCEVPPDTIIAWFSGSEWPGHEQTAGVVLRGEPPLILLRADLAGAALLETVLHEAQHVVDRDAGYDRETLEKRAHEFVRRTLGK